MPHAGASASNASATTPADEPHVVKDCQQVANNGAGRVRVRLQRHEGDGRYDGKKISAPSQTMSAR